MAVRHYWVQVDANIENRVEFLRILRRTGESSDVVFARLVRMWMWAARQTKGGFAPGISEESLGRLFGGDIEFWVAVSECAPCWLHVAPEGLTVMGQGKSAGRKLAYRSDGDLPENIKNAIEDHYRRRRAESMSVISCQKLRMQIMERDGAKCKWCGDTEGLALDHVTPVDAGGTDDPDNLQVLCTNCNSAKGSRVPTKVKLDAQREINGE